jgi:hypothetical protein
MEIIMKDNTAVNLQFVAGVGANLIICIALLMSVGVCQVLGGTLLMEPKQLKLSEPEQLTVSQPKQLKISEPEQLTVSNPEKLGVRKPRGGLVPRVLSSGVTVLSGNRENTAYNRCAKLTGFDDRHKCALDALKITEK